MCKIKHIGIAGPVSLPALRAIMTGCASDMPHGMGGVPVNHLIMALFRRGYNVSVYSSSPEIPVGESFEHHQDRLSIYMGPHRAARAKEVVKDFYKVERDYITGAIKKSKPDIVHAHWQYEWAWGALSANVPTLVTCHDSPLKVFFAQRDMFRLFRLIVAVIVMRKAKYFTSVSPYCAQSLKKITKKKIAIVPNFEPDSVFDLYKKQRTINANLAIAMINNGFTRLKNATAGILAFSLFRKKYPASELHLYGIGYGQREEAQQWCSKKNVCTDGIFFHGHTPNDVLMTELNKKDVLLHTSKEESFGIAPVEAMALGIPVIAGKNSGGVQWILGEGGGELVNIVNINEIVAGLETVCQNYEQKSQQAREISIRRFSEEVVVNQYIKEYERILK